MKRHGRLVGRAAGIARTRRLCSALALALTAVTPLRADELTVYAAASLTDALREAVRPWEAATRHRVVFSFGASSDLARQIRAGAPADAFFSADAARVDELERAALVKASERRIVLSNVLVVIAPFGSPLSMQRPADLLRVRTLALANPEAVPAGLYARAWLETAGLWPQVQPRIVPTLDVRAALAAVEAGHADAGIVYRTDARLSPRVRVCFEVPRESGPPITYVLAAVGDPPRPVAQELVRHLTSSAAVEVYRRFGFLEWSPP